MSNETRGEPVSSSNFIRTIIEDDLRSGRHSTVATRFPPEPNGYLHIGHAKAICIDFGMAEAFNGRCHLRMDDTNPAKEDTEYVTEIQRDLRWLGFDWGENFFFASDYFEQLFQLAVGLIEDGHAYVCSLTGEQMREYRGTVMEPGRPSPDRDRPIAESLDLFRRMRAGEFPDNTYTLRARIDLGASNMKLRDPPLYRIRHDHHHRTGDDWPIYPMYDYAHPLSDAIEGITHSLCSLEFQDNRALYDWVVDNSRLTHKPRQYEFARLALTYTVMSKRKLLQLVELNLVDGWDDPRMPTLSAFRRRGVRPQAIRAFAERVGVAKTNSVVEMQLLEHTIRDDLNALAPRRMAVLAPLRVTLTNWPEGKVDTLQGPDFPPDVGGEGSRDLPFSGSLYIERSDFQEQPSKKFRRLAPGREVRLRYGYIIRCEDVVKDGSGEVVELRCSVDMNSRGGTASDGRRVRGTIHWVSAQHAVPLQVRQYDRLFTVPNPDGADGDFKDYLNADSIELIDAQAEPALGALGPNEHVQLERQGYFFTDPKDSKPGAPVLNRTVALKDSWAKIKNRSSGDVKQAPKTPSKPKPAPKTPAGPAVDPRDQARADNPVLAAKMTRYMEELGLSRDDASVLTGSVEAAAFFEAALAAHDNAQGIANWMVNELRRLLGERALSDLKFGGAELGRLVLLIDQGSISGKAGKKVLAKLDADGGDPKAIVEQLGLRQISDPAEVQGFVDQVMAANGAKVQQYRDGRVGLMGFFIGQVIRATGGRANPKLVNQLVKAALDG